MGASGEKPYKVYRGGRSKGKVPLTKADSRGRTSSRGQESPRADGGRSDRPAVRRKRRRWTWRRWVPLTLVALVLVLVVWGVLGYFSVKRGVTAANARLPAGTTAPLKPQNGLMLSNASNVLLLGTDHSDNGQAGRGSDRHSDSMMLLRTDPGRHRLVFLSIPRDLRASIPGYGESKINAAMQIGGAKLAISTVSAFTGLPINHVVIVDFSAFQTLIDGIGGIDINVPAPILSNRFDCPFSTQQRCSAWSGWRFHKGVQHMDGHRALIYSRIRENRLNAGDSDITRALRQQQVMQQTLSKLASPSTFLRLPFSGSKLLSPIATDLSTWQFAQLGWVKFRAGSTLHCRLGGKDFGDGFITGTEENIAVVQMVIGNSAPQPPPPGSGPYGPGCVTGSEAFK